MRESKFVERNNQKWADLETSLVGNDQDPRKKSRLFIQAVDDLSFARTFYRNRSVREYLNGIAQLLFSDINLNERWSFKKIKEFFVVSFPKAMYTTRRSMLISFVLFWLCFTIGAITAAKDPDFAREILSNNYVEMTEANIESGDPMAVYKDSNEFEMFYRIAVNNIRVMFITFLLGVLSSIGTLLVIINNGVMVGVFQYFFIERGLFWDSFLTIWTHGTIEISCIIVAGGAGLQLGKGLLFPGTYSRIEAFKMSGKTALTVITGITPLVLLAAFIESFQTRHTEIPNPIRFGFILLCLAMILYYLFLYPRIKFRNLEGFKDYEQNPVPGSRAVFDTHQILGLGRIFSFSVGHLLKYAKRSISFLVIMSTVFALLVVLSPDDLFISEFAITIQEFKLSNMFSLTEYWPMSVLVVLVMTIILSGNSIFMMRKYASEIEIDSRKYVNTISLSFLTAFLSYIVLSLKPGLTMFVFFFGCPFLVQALAIANLEGSSLLNGPRLILSYLRSNWGKFIGLNLIFLIFALCFLLVVRRLLLTVVVPTITMLLTDKVEVENQIVFGATAALISMSFFGLVYFYSVGAHLLFFTIRETNTASHLFNKIKKLLLAN